MKRGGNIFLQILRILGTSGKSIPFLCSVKSDSPKSDYSFLEQHSDGTIASGLGSSQMVIMD